MNELERSIIERAKQYTKSILENDSSGHDIYHVFRVMNMAKQISKHYKVNNFVIELSALLHDLDDAKIAKAGSKYALTFLEENHVFEKEWIMSIIENMSFSSHKQGKTVESLEGKIVQDADRLDALGAIGIARVFAYSGYKKRSLYKGDKADDSAIAHFYDKLFKLPDLMNTEVAKKIAYKRVTFMEDYLNQFYKDWSEFDERI